MGMKGGCASVSHASRVGPVLYCLIILIIIYLLYKVKYAQINLFLIMLGQINLDCSYPFPIDLLPNEILFGAKSIGKV